MKSAEIPQRGAEMGSKAISLSPFLSSFEAIRLLGGWNSMLAAAAAACVAADPVLDMRVAITRAGGMRTTAASIQAIADLAVKAAARLDRLNVLNECDLGEDALFSTRSVVLQRFSWLLTGFSSFGFRRWGASQTTRGCAALGSGATPETEDEMRVLKAAKCGDASRVKLFRVKRRSF